MNKPFPVIFIIILSAAIIGCGVWRVPVPPAGEIDFAPPADISLIGMYDSMDTAVVESIDLEAKSITLVHFPQALSYTLEYNDTTVITDKYGQALSMAQIAMGDIVDVCFMKDGRRLVAMSHAAHAFVYENVTRYSLDGERGTAVIGDENYRLRNATMVISDGRRIETANIINRDTVTIRGIDRDIWSITVTRGHGYLRLMGDAYAIGGWIEVGQSLIQRISDNMLLTVPEGMVDVHVSAKGFSATRRVTITRGKETVIDLGDVEVAQVRRGAVVFNVTPATARVLVDGEEVKTAATVMLDFGLHQVICEAFGYDTVVQYIKVTEANAAINITMDVVKSNIDTGGGGSVSDNNLPVTGGGNYVYVDAPAGAEVYQDGVYMGIAPAYFAKVPGSHTLTFRRDGYVTKSYQVHIEDDGRDVTYAFAAMVSTSGGGSVSGNN